MPTKKLALQLTRTATDIAAGLGPWLNNSAVIIHGIEPGPTAKKTTQNNTETTASHQIHDTSSYSEITQIMKYNHYMNTTDYIL